MSKKKHAPLDNAAKEKIDVQAATLAGRLRDDILSIFKSHGKWKDLPEKNQRDLAEGAISISKDCVRGAAEIISARGFKSFHGVLQSVQVKDGLKLTITVNRNIECLRDLVDQQGGAVTIVLSDTAAYMKQRDEPDIDLDEPPLPLDNKKK